MAIDVSKHFLKMSNFIFQVLVIRADFVGSRN